MKTRNPTSEEIEELLSFLPKLYAEGFNPVDTVLGGNFSNGVLFFPIPFYNKTVMEFCDVVEKKCWVDYDYLSKNPERMFTDEDFIKNANLDEIKAMLTYCIRGERFCSFHLDGMIKDGYIRRILERLAELYSKGLGS